MGGIGTVGSNATLGSQPLQSIGTSRNIRSVTEVSRRGGALRNVGTEFKLMQELLRHSSLRSTLDIYTQAITPAKHAAQRAVLSLVFSPEKNLSSCSRHPRRPNREERQRREGNSTKRRQEDAIRARKRVFYTPKGVSLKSMQVL